MGYSACSKAYRIWFNDTRRIVESRDVLFDETLSVPVFDNFHPPEPLRLGEIARPVPVGAHVPVETRGPVGAHVPVGTGGPVGADVPLGADPSVGVHPAADNHATNNQLVLSTFTLSTPLVVVPILNLFIMTLAKLAIALIFLFRPPIFLFWPLILHWMVSEHLLFL